MKKNTFVFVDRFMVYREKPSFFAKNSMIIIDGWFGGSENPLILEGSMKSIKQQLIKYVAHPELIKLI